MKRKLNNIIPSAPGRNAPSLSALEAKKGMTLLSEGCTPRDVLSRFLGRYWGHDIKEGEHFEFSGEWSAHGFTAKITVWVWSDDAYWGHPCQDKKLAQDSRRFLSDPRRSSKQLPNCLLQPSWCVSIFAP